MRPLNSFDPTNRLEYHFQFGLCWHRTNKRKKKKKWNEKKRKKLLTRDSSSTQYARCTFKFVNKYAHDVNDCKMASASECRCIEARVRYKACWDTERLPARPLTCLNSKHISLLLFIFNQHANIEKKVRFCRLYLRVLWVMNARCRCCRCQLIRWWWCTRGTHYTRTPHLVRRSMTIDVAAHMAEQTDWRTYQTHSRKHVSFDK